MALTSGGQFTDAISRANHVLVTFRKEWTVDAVASALALAHVLEKKGKRVDVVADNFAAPKSLGFLPKTSVISPSFQNLQKFVIALDVSKTKIDELSYDVEGDKLRIHVTPKIGRYDHKDISSATTDFKYDLVIAVDSPDYGSLGSLFSQNTEFFYNRPVMNIDHDPANEQFGNMNYVDITATSCAEVIHTILKSTGEHFLDEEIATYLLTGIISKTRSFKSVSVTPRTLDIASELVAAGGRRDEIVQSLYRTRSIATLKLWGRALARLKFDPVTKIAWSVLVRQDFIHAGAEEADLADVIDELMMNSPESEIVGLLYEQDTAVAPGKIAGICALISTEKHASALGLVSTLKPEGDRRTARLCFPNTSILDAEKTVLSTIQRSLGKNTMPNAITSQPASLALTK